MLIAAAAIMTFYPLSEPAMVRIEADLKTRRGEIAA